MKTKKFKKEKGITLVALIITIIVLLILAMVSISLVMNSGIITKSKTSVDKYSEEEIGEQLKLAYSEYQMSQYTGTPMTTQDIQAKLREIYGNDTTASLENGKLTATIKGTTYEYDIATGKTQAGGNSTPTSFAAYAVGDVVILGGEDFYVIEASDASATTVKLLAKYNVKTESGEGQYTQTTDANKLRFDDNSNDYETSEIKVHVDAYKTALEGRMGEGKTIQEARLMTGTATGSWNDSHTVWTYTSGTDEVGALIDANKTEIVYETGYWLGSPKEGDSNQEWIVEKGAANRIDNISVTSSHTWGLRPVIVVLKSNI